MAGANNTDYLGAGVKKLKDEYKKEGSSTPPPSAGGGTKPQRGRGQGGQRPKRSLKINTVNTGV